MLCMCSACAVHVQCMHCFDFAKIDVHVYIHCTCIFVIIILKIMHAVLVHNDINLYNLF